jgi:hypothetical protein
MMEAICKNGTVSQMDFFCEKYNINSCSPNVYDAAMRRKDEPELLMFLLRKFGKRSFEQNERELIYLLRQCKIIVV